MKLIIVLLLLLFILNNYFINFNNCLNLNINNNNDTTLLVINNNNLHYYNYINDLYDFEKPLGFIKISNKDQLKNALMIAKNLNKRVSIRSGGHSPASMSILKDTINLDMSGLKGIKVDVEGQTITVESGVKMSEFYNELYKNGLMSTGGTCGDVGMGLALGGGVGYLGPKYGYAVDNVIEFTCLLENGTFVKANADNEFKDLYWALAGAGAAGFGIVYDFKLKAYPLQPLFYQNTISVPYDKLVDSITTLNQFVESLTDQEQKRMYFKLSNPLLTTSDSKSQNVFIFFYFIDGPPSIGEKYFNQFWDLYKQNIPQSTIVPGKTEKTFLDLLAMVSMDSFNHSSRYISKHRYGFLKYPNAVITKSIMDRGLHYLTKINETDPNAMCLFEIYYAGGNLIGDKFRGKNAFSHRDPIDKWSWEYTCNYLNPENDHLFQKWRYYVNGRLPIISDDIYQNVPDDDIDYWGDAYYGVEGFKKLQQIKLKYDPNNYFKYPQSIPLP